MAKIHNPFTLQVEYDSVYYDDQLKKTVGRESYTWYSTRDGCRLQNVRNMEWEFKSLQQAKLAFRKVKKLRHISKAKLYQHYFPTIQVDLLIGGFIRKNKS